MLTTASLLLDLLTARGVEVVFGVPGNHTVPLYRDLESRGIRHVTTRHEQGAAFMADGYARATGKPGVCVLISGPGLLNAATAIAQARADSVPMLIITGVASTSDLDMARGTLHELPDQHATAASICRNAWTLLDPNNLAELVELAFASFTTGRPGPALIAVPLDRMSARVERSAFPAPTIAPPGPDPAAIAAAAALLRAAHAPLLLLGGGAVRAGVPLIALAEMAGAPVLNTVNGKGVCPASHPLAVGGSPSLPCLRQALADADLIVAVGTEFGETDYDLLMSDAASEPGPVVRIDIEPDQLLRPGLPGIGICGDATLAAQALLEALEAPPPAAGRGTGAERAAALRAGVTREPHYHQEMQSFFDTLKRAAPGAVLVGDSTRPTYYAAWHYECEAPRRYFHSASGFGTLGYALPAAFGAALGADAPVIALIGDGGIQFSLPELTTGAELELGVAVIVWHNDGYREIENSMRAQNVPVTSTRVLAPDFEAAARAHHVAYERPDSLSALEAAVSRALARPRPTLIEVGEQQFLSQPSGLWY